MSDLVVIAYPDEATAFQARDHLIQLQKEHLIDLDDVVVVVRKPDGKVKIKQSVSLTGVGALQGSFWGMFIGLLFFAPWLGLAVGAITGALSGKFADIGVDDSFIKEVGQTIQPGSSALFLLIRAATTDKLLARLQYKGTVLKTSLSNEDEAKLVEALGGGE